MKIQCAAYNLLQESAPMVESAGVRLYRLFQKYFDWPITQEQFQQGLFRRLPGLRTDLLRIYRVRGKDVGYFHFRTYVRRISSGRVLVVRMSVGAHQRYRAQLPWKPRMVWEIARERFLAGAVKHVVAINWLTHPSSYVQCYRNFETFPAPTWHLPGKNAADLEEAFEILTGEYPFPVVQDGDRSKQALSKTGATVRISPEEIGRWQADPYGRYFLERIRPGCGFPALSRITMVSLLKGLLRRSLVRMRNHRDKE